MTNYRKNYYEELIDKMMIDEVLNEEVQKLLRNNPNVKKKRLAILSALEENNKEKTTLFLGIKKLLNGYKTTLSTRAKIVVKMLRDYVDYGDVEKNKFGEVMTPISLVEEMLDTLPVEVWTNPDLKWLDPANGVGIFPSVIVQRLMEGLKEFQPCEEKRYAHIMEEMLYVCELQPKNMFLYLCGFDPEDKYELNIYTGSFLDDMFDQHMLDVYGVEKFDIVVGNPPYQNYYGNSVFAENLYIKFVEKANCLSNSNIMIFPFRGFLQETKKDLIAFKNKMIDHGIEYLCHYHEDYVSKKLFPGLIIRGGLCVVKFKKNISNTRLLFIDSEENHSLLENVKLENTNILKYKNKTEIKIIQKVSNHPNTFKNIHIGRFAGTNEPWFKQHKTSESDLKIFVSKNKSKNGFLFVDPKNLSDSRVQKSSLWKARILIVDQDIKNIKICQPGEIFSHSFTGFIFNTKQELNNFIKICNSYLIRFLFKLEKRYRNQVTGEIFKKIPLLDLKMEWTNSKIYEQFNLSKKEIDYIETLINE